MHWGVTNCLIMMLVSCNQLIGTSPRVCMHEHVLSSTRMHQDPIPGTDLRRPMQAKKACPRVWEQRFLYYVENSMTALHLHRMQCMLSWYACIDLGGGWASYNWALSFNMAFKSLIFLDWKYSCISYISSIMELKATFTEFTNSFPSRPCQVTYLFQLKLYHKSTTSNTFIRLYHMSI